MTGIAWMPNKAQIMPLSHPWVTKEEGETVSSWAGLAEAPEDGVSLLGLPCGSSNKR